MKGKESDSRKGFGFMEPRKQREIAGKGDKSQGRMSSPRNVVNNPAKGRQTGRESRGRKS